MSKKRTCEMKNIHTRIPMRQYHWMAETCEKLGITQTEFWNELLEDRTVQSLIRLARSIKHEPRVIQLEMDDDTRDAVTKLTESMNALTYQTRALGRNVAHLLYDVNRKQLMDNLSTETLKVEAEMSELLRLQKEISDRYAALLYSEDGVQNIEDGE